MNYPKFVNTQHQRTMKNYLLFVLILSVSILAACNKDEEEPEPEPPTNYQPVSQGSYWTYSGYDGGQSFNVEINGLKDSINGYEYYGFNHTLLGEGWFRKEAGIYYNLLDMNGTQIEFPYLVDNVDTGHTWELETELGGVDTRLVYKILERDVDKVVFGQLFKEVIVVQRKTYLDMGSGFDSVYVNGEYWYANDIGFIFSDISSEGLTYLEFYKVND